MACKGVTKPTVDDRSDQDFLVFREGKLEIVKGSLTKAELDLTDFFIEADSYLCEDFDLLRNEEMLLKPGNMSKLNGEIQFIAIKVVYPEDTLVKNEYIHWKYPDTPAPTSPEIAVSPELPTVSQIMNLGKIMILSGSTTDFKGWDLSGEGSPKFGGLLLINPHDAIDVQIQIILVK